MNEQIPIVVAYGGGVNSTAMLCGMKERGIVPALITFADTAGEHPHTYEHVEAISAITQLWWGVPITTVRKLYQGRHEGLEGNCMRKKMLPSLAYGTKGCSMKYKVEPQTQYLLKWMAQNSVKVAMKAIGYDSGEGHRSHASRETLHTKGRIERFWYPLIEWQWRRADCIEAIKRHGLPVAHKSACFFCPATKRHEIITLRNQYPALYARALALEANAITTKDMGLTGGPMRWSDVVANDDAQGKLWDWVDQNAATPIPCGCFDG